MKFFTRLKVAWQVLLYGEPCRTPDLTPEPGGRMLSPEMSEKLAHMLAPAPVPKSTTGAAERRQTEYEEAQQDEDACRAEWFDANCDRTKGHPITVDDLQRVPKPPYDKLVLVILKTEGES